MLLEAEKWLDDNTKKIEIAIPVYNAEYGLYTLITVNFFFSRGGHIWKDLIAQSAFAFWFDSMYYALYDMTWAFCVSYVLYTEWKEVYQILSDKGCWALWTD